MLSFPRLVETHALILKDSSKVLTLLDRVVSKGFWSLRGHQLYRCTVGASIQQVYDMHGALLLIIVIIVLAICSISNNM